MQQHNISTSHVSSLKLKSNILFDSCVATQEIWSVVLCIVLDKVTHTMKFDAQTHKKQVCVCLCVTLRNSLNIVSVSVTLKCDANGSENPNANALFALLVLYLVGDSVPIRIPISFT